MPAILEADLVQVRQQIRESEGTNARERASADQLVASMREAGADLSAPDNFTKIDEAYKRADAARDETARLRDVERRYMAELGQQLAEPRTREEKKRSDMAARLLESDAYARLRASRSLESGTARVQMDPVTDVLTRDELVDSLRLRTTFDNSANVGSGLLIPDYTNMLIEQYVRKVKFLDVITIGETDTTVVDWIQEQTRTDAAAPTPYGTAVPESAYGFAHQTTNVKRIGHFVPVTKGMLADAGQTRTLLNQRLDNGLRRQLETQCLSGSGVGENLTGILTSAGFGVVARGSSTRLDAVHAAITNVRVNTQMDFDPTVICLSPSDYENLVLDKQTTGAYTFGAPTSGANPTIWGLLPVVSTAFTTGTPLIGDFKAACTLWVREGVTLSASDQHMDFFLKGLVALMAETRAAFATVRPAAVCEITGF